MKWPWHRSVEARRRLRRRVRRLMHPVWMGTLRRTTPVSALWGYDRGRPVDRYYIERFLTRYGEDIRGRVLEVKDSTYTKQFGSNVTRRDVLDRDPSNPEATIVTDLATGSALESDVFDCCIVTQTLHLVYDIQAAVGHLHRTLRPGGVLLATIPTVSRVDPVSGPGDLWRLTPACCARVFGDVFGVNHVTVEGHGNVLAAIAFLTGMAQEEFERSELDQRDDLYPVVVSIRAVKASAGAHVR